MSKTRLTYWLIYLAIVISSTAAVKLIERNSSLFDTPLNKYTCWIIYGTIVVMGYKNFVYDPRQKGE